MAMFPVVSMSLKLRFLSGFANMANFRLVHDSSVLF